MSIMTKRENPTSRSTARFPMFQAPPYKSLILAFLPLSLFILSFSGSGSAADLPPSSFYYPRPPWPLMGPRYPGAQRLYIRTQHPRVSTRRVDNWREYQQFYPDSGAGSAGEGNALVQSCSEEERSFCEECTKSARNDVVFPLCCGKKEGMFAWCEQFMNFELRSN